MKKIIALLFFLTATSVVWAQEDEAVEEIQIIEDSIEDSINYSIEADTTGLTFESIDEAEAQPVDPRDTRTAAAYMKEDVKVKTFDRDKWKEIVGNEKFQEKVPELPKNVEGWNFPGFKFGTGAFKLISIIVVVVLFAFIIYYLAQNITVKEKIKSIKPADMTAPVENIEEVDIEGLLRQALADGDLRLAVRLQFLLLLKKLNEAGLIIWKKDKTNRDYLSELYGRESVYDDVRKLTLAYELVWYGERSVSHESFQRIRGDFESVNRNVANTNTPG